MNKRGFSTIIVSLVLILVTLVAVGIVAVVIGNILQESSKKVSIDGIFLNLNVDSVKANTDGSISVNVKRNAGSGDLNAIKFILFDGAGTKVIEKRTNLNELEQNTFTISQSELGGFNVKGVSVAPVIKGMPQEVTSTKEISDQTQIPTIDNREVIVINFASLSEQQ